MGTGEDPQHGQDLEQRLDEARLARLIAAGEKLEAERDYFLASARHANANAEQYEITARTKNREEKNELAKDQHHHVYMFDKAVGEASVKECVRELTRWSRQSEDGEPCGIELQLNSPGGAINDGFALIDYIRGLQDRGHRVTTMAFGMAASMAGVILQVGNERIMGRNAFLLIHEGSLGAIGDVGDVEDRVELMHMYHDKIIDLFVEKAQPINPKTTANFIRKNWKRKDWWIPAEGCLKLGFIDAIR